MDFLGALIGGGAALGSAYLSSKAASDAADKQVAAINQGTAASQAAIQTARRDIGATLEPGLDDLFSGFQGSLDEIGGVGQAEQMALNMSGAAGQEAEQGAMDSFLESPGQQFLRDEQERALTRNASAIGGLGGGRVRSALQEEAYGRAATNQQQRFNNLSALINPEQQRSVNIGNTLAQSGQSLSGYRSGIGSNLANISIGGAAQQIPQYNAVGSAQAASAIGQSNAWGQGITNFGKTLGEVI